MKPALQAGGHRPGTRTPGSSSSLQPAVSSPCRREIGGFRLEFAPSGKLRTLVLPSGASLLHREDRDFDLGGGRLFRPEGWDECFPTIEPWNGSPAMGELVWAEPDVQETPGEIEQVWNRPDFVAARGFRLRSARELELAFRVRNRSGGPLEFLWASHAVFSIEGLAEVRLPDGGLLDDFSLDGSSSKFFARSGPALRLRRAEGEVRLTTDQPWWGIWLNRGGWPERRPAGMGCIGIEATNCAADRPQGAVLEADAWFRGAVIVEDCGDR